MVNEMAEACGTYGVGERNMYFSVGKPEGKGQLERPRRRWENNVKIYLQVVGWGSMDWIELAQDRDR
jgi:hypothetical protein